MPNGEKIGGEHPVPSTQRVLFPWQGDQAETFSPILQREAGWGAAVAMPGSAVCDGRLPGNSPSLEPPQVNDTSGGRGGEA